MVELPYEMDGNVARFRLTGSGGLEGCMHAVRDVILHAKQAGVRMLLVDVTAIDAGPPSVAERHWIMSEWAIAGRGAVRLALVIRPEFIDPDNFGTSVALNRGLAFKGFTSEARAMDWLLGRRSPEPPPA